MPHTAGMQVLTATIDQCQARWVTDRELGRIIGIAAQTLRNWRVLDARDGRRRGGLVYRRFGDSVRYWLDPALLEGRP